ncbi:MAG TPA: adenine phosphoribosyltransferase [Pseudoclavibacter sp.]|nr:adenine phosphoribosyltransferase [Pseudoclavibacter sp.]
MDTSAALDYLNELTDIVPDFPRPGILFRDLTPVLADARALHAIIDEIVAPFAGEFTAIAGIEARGFLLASAAAYATGVGALTIRKAGKLPGTVIRRSYALEYGEATLEMHPDALDADSRVLLLDDVLATGGTLEASASLVEQTGATVVGMGVALELAGLGGRETLTPRYRLHSLQTVTEG